MSTLSNPQITIASAAGPAVAAMELPERRAKRRPPELDKNSQEGREDAKRRRWSWFTIGILLMSTAFAGLFNARGAYDRFDEAREKTAQQVQVYSKMVAAHDRFEITMADQIIKSLIDHIDDGIANGDTEGDARKAFEAVMADHRARLPGIASFTIIGADGIRRFGVAGKNFTDLSSRPYFKYLQAGKSELFVSAAEEGLASGKQGVHVARRLSRPDGSFGGVVVINLAVDDVFKPYYQSLGLKGDVRIQLRTDNKLIMEFPEAKAATLSAIATELINSGKASGLVAENQNGEKWVEAVERLPDTMIFAQASMSEDEALKAPIAGAWQAAMLFAVAAFGAGCAIYSMRSAIKRGTELALAYVSMRRMATHDKLTDLPNRAYLGQHFVERCKAIVDRDEVAGVVFIDLDKFKSVNDTYGHKAGDALLKQVSARFIEAAGKDALVSRLAGDEFMILASLGKDFGGARDGTAQAKQLCDKVLKRMAEKFDLGTSIINSGASLGVARFGRDGEDLDALSHKADKAMYRAKQQGRGQFAIYDPAKDEDTDH